MAVAQIINDQTRQIYKNLIPPTSASLLDEITVASSQATQQTKDLADYTCSGTNDEQQIQQAIDDANNAGGGTVKLSDGTFFVQTQSNQYQSTDCCIFLREHVALVGEGRATTKIEKTDAGTGFALIQCYQQGTGMSVLDLDLDMDNKQNINVCLRAIQTNNSRYANIAFTKANTGFKYFSPENCIAQDLFFVDCSECLNLDNNDATLNPYIANIHVNDGLQPLAQFGFQTQTAVHLQGSNWTVSNVIMRVCNDKAIHFDGCSSCVVTGVNGVLLQNAFYFESNAEDCKAEDVEVVENYHSPVCVIQGNRNRLDGWLVTDAGWDTNVQAVQPDSEKTSPFTVTGNGHRIVDLKFNEVDFTYSFNTVRAGVIVANNCDDLALQELKLNGNSQGKINPPNEIGYGININNSKGIRCGYNDINNTEGYGYFLDDVTSTDDIKSYVIGGRVANARWGFYTQNGCSRIDIQDITFYRCESSAMQLGASNAGSYNTLSGIKCYDTGGGGSTGGSPAVIKVRQQHNTLDRIHIYNDQHGYFDNKSTGLFINNSHTHVSRCYVDGNVSDSLSIDVNSNNEKALNRGIYIAGPPSNKDFTITDCYVYNCLRAGVQIGSSTSGCLLQGGRIKNTGNNSTPTEDSYNLQIADSNVVNANGIKNLQVLSVSAEAGQYTTDNYKRYGNFGNDITFKENTGLPNDTSDYREQLKHGLNAYYSFDGSDFLGDKFGIHHASETGGGSVVQGSSNGIMGDCAVFNGTLGDYIDPPVGAFDFRDSPFTWSFWFYVANITSNKKSLVEARGNSFNNAIGVVLDGSTQNLGMFTIVNGNSAVEVFGSSTIQASTWYHVIMKRDENDNYALYVNSQLEAEDLQSSGTLSRASNLTGFDSAINPPTFSGALDGRMDEVACYFRDLAPHHLDQLYAQGNGTQSMLEYKWHDQPAQSDVHMNGHKITNVGAPANAQDVTSKRYVDGLAGTPPLKDQLRAYYSFDGDYTDSTTNNYDGTPITGTTFNNSTAIINQSLEFTSDSDKVDIGNAMKFGTGDFTVSFWVYPNTADTTRRNIISFDQNSGFFNIEYGYADTGVFRLYTNDSGGDSVIATSANYPPGQWFFVVVTRTGATGQIWVDAQKAVEGTIQSGNIASGTSFIGGNPPSGFIDECGAWNRVLSQQEILHLYNNGNGTQYLSTYDWYAVTQQNHVDMNGYRVSNLGEALQSGDAVDKAYVDSRAPMAQLYQGARAYYTFDGDYTDSIGSFDGTNNGASFTTGQINQGADLSGSDTIDLGDAGHVLNSDFSIGAWYYPKSLSDNNYIIYNSSVPRYGVFHQSSGNGFSFYTEDSNGVSSIATGSFSKLNQWYYIVAEREGSTGRIYVNGVLEKSGAVQPGVISTSNATTVGRSGFDADFRIDELGVWSRALTENEVKYLYHEGQGTQEFTSYDYTFNYDIDMNQNQIFNLASAHTTNLTITDNAVNYYAPPNNYGVAMLHVSGDIVMIMYDVTNNNTQFVHQFGSLFANEGGTNLTGIDGTDGKVSISSNSGQIHVENRSGSQITVRLLVIF